jgi:hypothetical protein
MKGTDPATGLPPHDEPRVDPLPGAAQAADSQQYDRDLNVKGILWSAVYLAGGVLVVCLLMYWLFLGLRKLENRADPPAPPLAEERREQPLPPEPRLQASPDQDMLELRAREDRALHQPAWIDQKAGTVRLPIDLAMDVIARRGLPATGADAPSPSEARLAAGTAAAAAGQAAGQTAPLPGQPAAAPPAARSHAAGAGLGERQGAAGPVPETPAAPTTRKPPAPKPPRRTPA